MAVESTEYSDTLLFKGACPNPECGSSDACATYSDGHRKCFSCGKFWPASDSTKDGSPPVHQRRLQPGLIAPVDIQFLPLSKRAVTEETCRKFGYGIFNGKQYAPYYSQSGSLQAYHIRGPNKDFYWEGKASKVRLFGQDVWPGHGRRVVVCEGEVDCLSVSQALGNTWPVVSLPNGASAAKKSLADNLEWLERHDSIVLWFDNDEPGQDAVKACTELFTPGKAKYIVTPQPHKDANDVLRADGAEAVRKLVMFDARDLRPDGIVNGNDQRLREYVTNFTPRSDANYPWPRLSKAVMGMRREEILLFVAGTGVGKSTLCREIAYHLGVVCNQKVGIIALEEGVETYLVLLTSLALNQRLILEGGSVSREEKQRAYDRVFGTNNFELYDHFGASASENLLARMRYMVKGLGCRWLVFDHITLATGGNDSDRTENDEAQIIMKSLRALCQETGVGILVVAQLKKASGKAFEEGAQISLGDVYGSKSITSVANAIFALERNQQAAEGSRDFQVRLLKDRYLGRTGVVGYMTFDDTTGRVVEIDPPADFQKVGQKQLPTPRKELPYSEDF